MDRFRLILKRKKIKHRVSLTHRLPQGHMERQGLSRGHCLGAHSLWIGRGEGGNGKKTTEKFIT